MKRSALYIYGIVLTYCLYVPLAGMQGVILTTKREPINPDIKKTLTNVIIQRPEELTVDERIFIKIPKFLKDQEYSLVNAASDVHIQAAVLMDFIDAVIKNVQKTGYQDDLLITKKDKQHMFEILAQMLYLEIPYTKYLDLEEKYRATDFFNTINYIQECQCFSRRSHPFRKEVEKRILKHLEAINFDKSKTLIVTEFASGRLFEIFMIANLLIENGYKNLQINCIDLEYQSVLEKYTDDLSKKDQQNKSGTTLLNLSSYPWKKMRLSQDQIQQAQQSRLFYPISTILEQLQAYLQPRDKKEFKDLSKTEFKKIQTKFTGFQKDIKKFLSKGLPSTIYSNVKSVQTNLLKLQNIDFKNIRSHKTTIDQLQELIYAITQESNDPNQAFIEDELATDYRLLLDLLSMDPITKETAREKIIDDAINTAINEEKLLNEDEIKKIQPTKEAIEEKKQAEIAERSEYLAPLFSSLNSFEYHQRITQFLRWFSDDKNNNVTVVFYDDVQKYLDDCAKNEKLKSDIVVAIDYYPWDTFKFWDALRKDALKKDGAAFTVINFTKSGNFEDENGVSDLQYYLSLGTPTTLKHYEWVLQGKEDVIWNTETRIINGKTETFKVPNYTKYKLKKISFIPESKMKEWSEDEEKEIIKTVPAIPEITSKEKTNNKSVTLFAQGLSDIVKQP